MVLAPIPLLDWKGVFRSRAKAARQKAAKDQPNAARFAATAFMAEFEPGAGTAVAIYAPTEEELGTAPLAEALMTAGCAVLLPVVVGKKEPLKFRLWEVGTPLEEGPYGIMQPPADARAMRPDMIVCPLLAVRPDGARLGMGGGFYDRTLAALRADGDVLAVGYGYGAQRFDRFPVDAHDQFLDGFVSEQGAIRIDRRR